MALVIFHLQDEKGNPLGGVLGESVGGPGPWAAESNLCGDMKTELQGYISEDEETTHYDITFTKKGYADRTLAADIGVSGIIYVGLEKSSTAPTPVPPESILPPGVLPPIPTRAQVCAIQHSLAGLTYHTVQFGDIPAWFYGALLREDRALARQAHRDAGDTHIPFPISEAYREGGTQWPAELANGYDYTQNLETYRALAIEIIRDGFFIDCPLAGDGLGNGPDYNDPVGRTYGCGWLMKNLERIIRALQGDGTPERPDLTPYIIFRPGWDAVFYSWGGSAQATRTAQGTREPLRWWRQRLQARGATPVQLSTKELDDQQQRVKAFGELFRQILPLGYLAIEHTPGNIPVGEGGGDYLPGGLMCTYDTIMGEYDTFHQDSYWQIGGRMIRPWNRPPDQPAGDDPHPPMYLSQDNPRGPFFYVVFEPTRPGAYEWCRGRCTLEQIKQEDAYIRASGATLTGYPSKW
jgi:hypothetical protein